MKKIVVLLLLISSFIWGATQNLILENLNFQYTCDEGNLSSKVLFAEYRKAKVKLDKKRKKLKKIIKNRKLPLDERFNAQLKLAKLPRSSSKTRIRNRCEMTGRPRGVYRKLKISRIALRELASKGIIPGMTKSSW